MTVLSYQNLPVTEKRTRYYDMRNGYRMDFPAGHSDWRYPETARLKAGVAGGMWALTQVGFSFNDRIQLSGISSYVASIRWQSAFNTNQITWTKTTLDARTDNVLLELVVNYPSQSGAYVKGAYLSLSPSFDTSANTATVLLEVFDANNVQIFSQTKVLTTTDINDIYYIGYENDGAKDFSKITIRVSIVSYTFVGGAESLLMDSLNIHLFLSGIRDGYSIANDLGKLYPVIQNDTLAITKGNLSTTPVEFRDLINKGIEEHSFTLVNVELMEGGKTYQLIAPAPNKSVTILGSPISIESSKWFSPNLDEAVNRFLGEENIYLNNSTPAFVKVTEDDDVGQNFFASAYVNSIWRSLHRLEATSAFVSTGTSGGSGAGVYPGIAGITSVYRQNVSIGISGGGYLLSLPAGTYKIRWRMRTVGAANGEVTWVVDNAVGMRIVNETGGGGTEIYRAGRILLQGEQYVYHEASGSFVMPAAGRITIQFEIAVGTTAAINVDGKRPVFDGIMIYDDSVADPPTAYNSGFNHPFAMVLMTDEDPSGDVYSAYGDEGWVENPILPKAFFDLYASDATFPAPVPASNPIDLIDWTCNCPDEKALMNTNLGYIAQALASISTYISKLVQIVSNTKPSALLMELSGNKEGIDIYNDDNVTILWLNTNFEFMSRFIVHNGEIIEIANIPGSPGYVQAYPMSLDNTGKIATVTVQTYGNRFIPMVYVNSGAKATIGIRLRIVTPSSGTLEYQWVNRLRSNAQGFYDMFYIFAQPVNAQDMANIDIAKDLNTLEYTFIADDWTAAESGNPVGGGEDAGDVLFSGAMLQLHYL